ncbi:MAG: glycoside hydrolase family 16 protein [Bdellovibrionales bacterium]|nr:glycoside hydrolase family 16 protein [Bdellovibrionales bacterium]
MFIARSPLLLSAIAALSIGNAHALGKPPYPLRDTASANRPTTPAVSRNPVQDELRPSIPVTGYNLVWEDEFKGRSLDSRNWTAWNKAVENAYDDPDSVHVDDGELTIQTHTERDGLHHSGFLSGKGHFETTYGYFEARINFHDSPGSWCAFWLESSSIVPAVPNVTGVEVDVVEHLPGNPNSYPVHVHNWSSNGFRQDHTAVGGSAYTNGPSLEDNYHTYGVLWTPQGYTFFLDGVKQWQTSAYASHDKKYMLLTCEVLDNSWAGSIPRGGYGNASQSKTRMKVDWVRVWQKN